jgi:hypothetical protein
MGSVCWLRQGSRRITPSFAGPSAFAWLRRDKSAFAGLVAEKKVDRAMEMVRGLPQHSLRRSLIPPAHTLFGLAILTDARLALKGGMVKGKKRRKWIDEGANRWF